MTYFINRGTSIQEGNLYEPIVRKFNPTHDTYTEVPYLRKRVDLVLVPIDGSTHLIAVELKVSDWKGALKQAAENQLFADISYVALPSEKLSSVSLDRIHQPFEEYGVGLLSVNNHVTEVIRAKTSPATDRADRASVLDYLLKTAPMEIAGIGELLNGEYSPNRWPTAFLPAGSY